MNFQIDTIKKIEPFVKTYTLVLNRRYLLKVKQQKTIE